MLIFTMNSLTSTYSRRLLLPSILALSKSQTTVPLDRSYRSSSNESFSPRILYHRIARYPPKNFPFPRVESSGTNASLCFSSCTSSSVNPNSNRSDGDCALNGSEAPASHDSGDVYETILSNSGESCDLDAALDSLGMPLTTSLVVDVIGKLRYEEKLAFRFFIWASHQKGYVHEHDTFNDMIGILSSTKYKAKQFGVLCDVLDHMKRNDKNLISIDALLRILRDYSDKHLTRATKSKNKWRTKVQTQPEINAFNLLIDGLCKCCLVREADEFVSRIKKKLQPNARTYNILFFGWCRVRNPKKAMKVMEEMIHEGHTPESFTYITAIDTFCNAGMVSEARELFEFMRTEGSTLSSPTAKTYSIMIVALAKAGRMDECFKLLEDMRSTGCTPDVSTYKELIEGMCIVGKVDEAYRLLEDMGSQGYPPDILTFNCFLKVLCKLKKVDEAMELCERMIGSGCEPSVHTYNMLITMFFEVGDHDRAFGVWQEMSRRQCPRDVDTYAFMMDGLFSCGRPDDAHVLLDEVMDLGIKLPYRLFENLLSKLSETGNLRAIHKLSEHMKKFYNRAMARRHAITQKKKSLSLRKR